MVTGEAPVTMKKMKNTNDPKKRSIGDINRLTQLCTKKCLFFLYIISLYLIILEL